MKRILLPLLFCLPIFSMATDGVKIRKEKTEFNFRIVQQEIFVYESRSILKEVLNKDKVLQRDVAERVYFNDFQTIESLSAATLIPKSKGYKKIKVKQFQEVDQLESGVFYSGTKKKIINFPEVDNGVLLSLDLSKKYLNPRLLSPYYFSNYYQTDTSELIINVPSNVDIAFQEYFFEEGDHIQYSKSELPSGEIQHKWVATGLKSNVYEKNDLGSSCRFPHVVFRIKTFQVDGKVKPVLRDVNDLFEWYYSLIEDQKLDPGHQNLLDSLLQVPVENNQRAAAVLNWVQRNVKYIAYEDGMGGFIPRSPNSVMKNRYGDCKDMALLTKTLMDHCGLKCEIAWVGTRDKCYNYQDNPTPIVDNHMIAVVPLDSGFYFLDPTSRYLEYATPSAFIQGKEVMVYNKDKKFKIVDVPFVDASLNKKWDKVTVNQLLEEVAGKGVAMQTGYRKVNFEYRHAYRDESDVEFFRKELKLGNNSFQIKDMSSDALNTSGGTAKIRYEFDVKNYVQTFKNEVYFSPFLVPVIDLDFVNRKTALSNPFKYTNVAEVTWVLPKGYTVRGSIDDFSSEQEGISLDVKVQQEEGKLIFHYSFTNTTEVIYPHEFDTYRKLLKSYRAILKQQITLTNEK